MSIDEKMKQSMEKNLFLKRYAALGVKEALFSDAAGALGHMQRQVVRCAYPKLIGRRIISTFPTKLPYERFPVEGDTVAYSYAEGSAMRLSGKKTEMVDISPNILAQASEQWTQEFIEDSTWNVLESTVDKLSRAIGRQETQHVIDLYGSIEDDDLAGGEFLDQGNQPMDWDAVIALYDAVRGENWFPNVLVFNPRQLSQLILDNKFIQYDYMPTKEVDLQAPGLVRYILDAKVESSTLVPNGTAYAMDATVAAAMLIRRDVTVEEFSDPKADQYGVKATTRFGLGILRSNAVAKMTNIKTTLD